MTTQELINYYAGLLILQYVGKPRAYATIQALVTQVIMPQTTIQEIVFPSVPVAGTFKLVYDEEETTALAWSSGATAIQTALRLLTGLDDVTVTGSIASQSLIVTFVGITPPALELSITDNSLLDGDSADIEPVITAVEQTLPIAVQDAFNLSGDTPAVGAQLDILGKYAGVSRRGVGFNGQPITLDDTDFLTFIRMAILTNNADASLETIQNLIIGFFSDEILVFDYKNMRLSYLISTAVGGFDLIQLFITEGLLPKPTGVQLSVIYTPDILNLFGFRTYDLPAVNVKPFNNYDDYQIVWPWVTYDDGIVS
jgi:hypothetical protein